MAFDIAPYSGAIEKISDLAGGVIKRIWPEKMSELDRAKMQQELTMEMLRQDWSGVEKEFQDRADARALAQKDVDKGNWFTNVLAATVRPVFGYIAMGAFTLSVLSRLTGLVPMFSLNDIEKEIVLSIIYFYFGGRTVEKGIAMWKGGK